MRYAKGHGTGNDFIVLPDVDDQLELSDRLVRRLCDRRTGLGADGVLRVVAADPDAGRPQWFMDYRNADGSIAEMCGNGIRVFARYLLDSGLADGPEILIGTRAGQRTVRRGADGLLSADIGPVTVAGTSWAVVGGRRCEGLAISVGNPHLACLVTEPVGGFDLSSEPEVDAGRFPDGVNVEMVRVVGDRKVEMTVHERGSGATLSCGTGAVAAAVAAAVATGGSARDAQPWTVEVPGGRLYVSLGEESVLTGPAVLVADGVIDPGWLADQVS